MQILQLLAALHLALLLGVGALQLGRRSAPAARPAPPHETPRLAKGRARAWFDRIKPYCNPVEVQTAMRRTPPPDHPDAPGYQAACYALAGRIGEADALLAALDEPDAHRAAATVFAMGHPVADAGDDDSAGPIMRLVVKYQPRNFMALYHSGVSAYNLGDHALARDHLTRFLDLYHREDGWRANGEQVLRRIEEGRRGSVFSGKHEG